MAIFTAIAASIVSAFALPATILGVSTASLIGGAIAIGASYALSAALAPKAGGAAPRQEPGKTPLQQATLNQSVGPRVRGYGRAKLSGTRAFWDSTDGALYQAIMVHSGEIDEFEEWWIGDIEVSVSGDEVMTSPFYYDGGSSVFLQAFRGTSTQLASTYLTSAFSGWTNNHRLLGIAYIMTRFYSPPAERFQEVFPESYNTPIRTVARLTKVLDPRTDVTAWSDNAALAILDYLTHNDGYKRSIDDIDVASFEAMADICDELVTLKEGGTEKRYRLWGVYTLTEDPHDVLQRMLLTCDGELYQTASGKIAIRGGEWVEPTVTIEAANIISHQLEQGNNRFAAFNQLKIIHVSPDHDYQSMELTPWDDEASQAELGVLASDITYDLVPSAKQALRLAKIHIAKGNPHWRGTIVTNLVGLDALGERAVYITIPELGIDDSFLITGFSIRPDLTGCELSVSSLDASAYDWNPATEELDPAPEPADTRPPLIVAAPEDLTLRVVASTIRATVSPSDRTDVQLEAEYRTTTGPGVWQAMSVASGSLEAFSGTVTTGTSYDVRARWRTASGSAGDWTATTTIPVVIGAASPAAPTGFAAVAAGANASLTWTHSVTSGFYFTEVFRGATTTFGAATKIAEVYGAAGAAGSYVHTAPGSGTHRYWVRSVNVAGATSAEVGPQTVTL